MSKPTIPDLASVLFFHNHLGLGFPFIAVQFRQDFRRVSYEARNTSYDCFLKMVR